MMGYLAKISKLSQSAFSVFVYGVYFLLLGMIFLFLPNIFSKLMGIATTSEVWIYVAAWFVIWPGIYYIVSAYTECRAFIRTTVYGRPTFIIFLGVLVALGMIAPFIIIIGVIDFLTAVWTYSLLRSERTDKVTIK